MIKYLSTTQTNIITTEDINLISLVKRIEDDKEESYSIFRKVSGFKDLNNQNMMYNMASMIVCIELTKLNNKEINKDIKEDDVEHAYGLMYKKDDFIYVEPIIAKSIKEATDVLSERVDSYSVDKDSISIYNIGQFIIDDNNIKMNNLRYIINIKEQPMASIIIKKGLDSFKEFNRKIYSSELKCEEIEDGK